MTAVRPDSNRRQAHPESWLSELSAVAQDYLKAIWNAQEWSSTDVTTSFLAERMHVSASTVSEAIRKLVGLGLVVHERYGSVSLTDRGRAGAVLMVRRHRLIESFLVRELGYGWDEVHDEAEILEHAVSDQFVERLDLKLAFPVSDPHGDPIPDRHGNVPTCAARPLSDLLCGATGHVARISDDDPEMLRYFNSVGIAIDCRIRVVTQRPFAGTIEVEVDGETVIDLGDIAARAIWVAVRSDL